MYKLIKLKELSGYRFFDDFKWDENNCALFARYNIIYGWNGSGKTTLCDFFKDLETGAIIENGAKTSLLFLDTVSKNNVTITHNKLNTIPYEFRVYHSKYIQDTISEVDKVKHIFAVGTGQKERIEELKQLKIKLKNEEASFKSLNMQLSSLNSSFEQLKSGKASAIKNAANYTSSYNKNKFYSAYQALQKSSGTVKLTGEEYQQALRDIRAEKKSDILIPEYDFIRPSVKEFIIPVLEETPINTTIDALKSNGEINDWVERGLSIHEDKGTTTCQFCGNEISEVRFDMLKAHFNKSYKELSDKIDNTIRLLKLKAQQFETANNSLPNSALFYSELKDEVDRLATEIRQLTYNNKAIIEEIVLILTNKKSDMINLSYVAQFEEVVDKIVFDYAPFEKLVAVIVKHNAKTAEFQKGIEAAQNKIERHMLSESVIEINKAGNDITLKMKELDKQQLLISDIKLQIDALDKEVRNSQIPAEAMNRDIAFIMGRNELIFENKPLGYQITRKGKIAKNLSKGEENAIALIYFFNTLLDVDADLQNTIVILDDPISSFDSNFYYNAISYIRDKTSTVGQVFVFTHKFSLLKDYSLMYKGETNRYMIQRVNDIPALLNEDNLISQYYDEYAFLFKQVYQFIHTSPNASDYLLYPNIARRLLEGFLTFKMPSNDTLIDKVLKLEEDGNTAAGRAMLRLLNNYSHLRVISDNSTMENAMNISALPDTLKYLLKFIKHYDERHYNILVQQCNPNESTEEVIPSIPIKQKIKLYDMPVSAGTGMFLFDENIPYEEIEVENADCSFGVRISGDSMEPDIPNGSIVLVKQTEEVPHAKIGIFLYDGEAYCKKKVDTPEKLMLISLNKEYEPIHILDDATFRTFGEVIQVMVTV